ncbi:hypothetical protein N7E81_04815 [Reichenbachiella carrageenanivorans]|uniref:Lipocalin-like domain-containing protein n=1 Tax=Reichenbachiella carrageenanivorans TaxID=2979869 RepID=A0ABY6D968_9BACT|nr:hypothetical protein [Reichenbachiella carrageenanivorans]UXX80420.1 hypothetical protein N7E81_04815 [Reichenbachiella carrageenanivorans]
MKNVLIALLVFGLVSCSAKKDGSLRESELIGKWTNVSLLVTMKRLEKQDSVLQAKEGEWEKVLKMKPILSEFHEDHTFTAQYSNLQEEIIKEQVGKWLVRNDSLVIVIDGAETVYQFDVKNDRVTYKAKMDWDGDGHANDFYDAVQVKVND